MSIEQMNHVVIGAGPVARSVVAALVRRNCRPRVISRSGTEIHGAVSVIADMSEPNPAALADADVVYQCAQPPYQDWTTKFVPLQRSIVESCSQVGALLVAIENVYGYGPVSEPMHEQLPLVASTRKGGVRAQMWRELEAAHREGTVRTVAARASDFFGPGVEASAFGSRLFAPLVAGKGAEVLGDADRLHTITYIDDIGEAMVRLADIPTAWGRAWHVPNAPTSTTRHIVELAARSAGVPARIRPLPAWKLRLGALFMPAVREQIEMMYQFTRDFVVDDTAYIDLTGAEPTDLETALTATVEWYRSQA